MKSRISVGKLVRHGLLKTGDYVDYTPVEAVYKAKPENTGYDSEQIVHNCKKVNWVVAYVNKETGEAFIMPEENIIEKFYLYGLIGYMNGPNELNNICEALGSNAKLGLKARCVNIDDINKITSYKPENYDNLTRYAYYPEGRAVRGSIIYDNRGYVETIHRSKRVSKIIRFYEADSGGSVEKDEIGFSYRVPDLANPVLITETFYKYNIRTKSFKSDFWIASPCVSLYPDHVGFCIRVAYKSIVGAAMLYSSDCFKYINQPHGVRPIVSLGSNVQMDIDNDNNYNDSTKHTWKFAVEEETTLNIDSDEKVNKENECKKNDDKNADEDKNYKILVAKSSDSLSAIKELENKVNELYKQGFEVVEGFKVMNEDGSIVLYQPMRKKALNSGKYRGVIFVDGKAQLPEGAKFDGVLPFTTVD